MLILLTLLLLFVLVLEGMAAASIDFCRRSLRSGEEVWILDSRMMLMNSCLVMMEDEAKIERGAVNRETMRLNLILVLLTID